MKNDKNKFWNIVNDKVGAYEGRHNISAAMETSRAPDGGWGWVIVFASFMIHVIGETYQYLSNFANVK